MTIRKRGVTVNPMSNPYHRIFTPEVLRALQQLSTNDVCPIGNQTLPLGLSGVLMEVQWVEKVPCAASRYGGARLTQEGRRWCQVAGFYPVVKAVG